MNDIPTPPPTPSGSQPPSQPHDAPLVRRRWRISLVWLVPAVAAIIGLAMLVHTLLGAGDEITISFRTAAGLDANKTAIKYKDVNVGKVTAITLSDDGSHVLVKVALAKSAKRLTRKDTRFWVVRPRVSASGVSGIDTLLSGAYIGADPGVLEDSADRFTGLETAPAVIRGSPGKPFDLSTDDLGSLDIGSPVYYKRIHVGRVTSYQLSPDGKRVHLQIFVDAPYDRFVTADARFWNASGVDASVNADGLRLKTQSLTTIVAGGIAFDVPDRSAAGPADPKTRFTMAQDQRTALAPPDGPAQSLQLRFQRPLRGLSVGAPVQFSGIDLGRVTSIDLDFDPVKKRFPTVVGVVIYPQRLGRARAKLPALNGDDEQQAAAFLGDMVAHGLRARARSGNLLTGQLYIALDFVPNAPKAAFDANARPILVPTVSGGFDQIQDQIAGIVGKVDKIPLESIGNNLNRSLGDLDKTLKQVNGQLLPQSTKTLQQGTQTLQEAQRTFGAAQSVLSEDAPLQQNIGATLQEVQQAARSVRTLTDMLGRHPEALLRGLKDAEQRPADKQTPAPVTTPAPEPKP
jgi:paraquat-inducible protein B